MVVPQGADQFLNAASGSEQGSAMTADMAPTSIRAGLRRALSGEFDAATREVREEIALQPSPTDIAARLADHVTDRGGALEVRRR